MHSLPVDEQEVQSTPELSAPPQDPVILTPQTRFQAIQAKDAAGRRIYLSSEHADPPGLYLCRGIRWMHQRGIVVLRFGTINGQDCDRCLFYPDELVFSPEA